jgi:hypothetical protein
MNVATLLNSEPVEALCRLYAAEYPGRAGEARVPHVPLMLNALGACAGFAAQVAVWRELILPQGRDPGEFLVHVTTTSNETFVLGEAVNLFLVVAMTDRLSFLGLAAANLASASELPDISELARHVAGTLGDPRFGHPRLPASIDVPELPRAGLAKTWANVALILEDRRAAEWPAFLGAAALHIVRASKASLPPPLALKVLLESAMPMSKLDPRTVEDAGFTVPPFGLWSQRALKPDQQPAITAEVRAVMPVQDPRPAAPGDRERFQRVN